METFKMWETLEDSPVIEYYRSENRKTDAAVVVFPGGGYCFRAPHEGEGYALYLNSIGIDAFVCEYRVFPNRFPVELLDARRAVRFVRANSEKFGIDPAKVSVMGSSAGGHLAALVSTYLDPIDGEGVDETDTFPFLPDATILCYAVIHHPDETKISHYETYCNLMGADGNFKSVSPDLLVSDATPPAFIWHTATDPGVDVRNCYLYASALRAHNIPHELHVFGRGGHGIGTANGDPYVSQWTTLLKNWFIFKEWLKA